MFSHQHQFISTAGNRYCSNYLLDWFITELTILAIQDILLTSIFIKFFNIKILHSEDRV
jgi:hypothetical protein